MGKDKDKEEQLAAAEETKLGMLLVLQFIGVQGL